jgi:hypothetical protein
MRMAISRYVNAPSLNHELLLNRLFVVVTENRDGLKNKWSSPRASIFSADGRGCAVVKDVPTGGVPIAIQP